MSSEQPSPGKLTLSKETLHALTDDRLADVVGGASGFACHPNTCNYNCFCVSMGQCNTVVCVGVQGLGWL